MSTTQMARRGTHRLRKGHSRWRDALFELVVSLFLLGQDLGEPLDEERDELLEQRIDIVLKEHEDVVFNDHALPISRKIVNDTGKLAFLREEKFLRIGGHGRKEAMCSHHNVLEVLLQKMDDAGGPLNNLKVSEWRWNLLIHQHQIFDRTIPEKKKKKKKKRKEKKKKRKRRDVRPARGKTQYGDPHNSRNEVKYSRPR